MIDIMVPVWGKRYCDYLTDYFLPSLMAPRNLSLLRAEDGHRLLLATDPESWRYITSKPIIQKILEHIFPEWIKFEPQGWTYPSNTFEQYSKVISEQNRAQRLLLSAQKGRGCLLSPDCIFSDGVIACILRHPGLILIPALRQVEEDLLPNLKLPISPKKLSNLAIQHIHPEVFPYIHWDDITTKAVDLPINPPFRIFPQANGILLYTHHAVMFGFPPGGRIPDNIECEYFGKNFYEAYIVSDSNECTLVCIGPRATDWSTTAIKKKQGTFKQLVDIRRSNKIYCHDMPLKAELSRTPIRWRYGEPSARWLAKEKRMERLFYWALDNKIFGLFLDLYSAVRLPFSHLKGWIKNRC
jgi:hypothetical protein